MYERELIQKSKRNLGTQIANRSNSRKFLDLFCKCKFIALEKERNFKVHNEFVQ